VNSGTYSYYPGCSLHSTGLEYGLSTRAVFKHLGLQLIEVPEWNCCGASSAHAIDHQLAAALPARNLAIAQQAGYDLVAPCAACFNRLKGADYLMRTNLEARAELEALIGFKYSGEIAIRPLMAVLYEDYGTQQLAGNIHRPLQGLKVVPYYGCLLVRPPQITQFDNPEDPRVMGELLATAGAQVLPWSYATDCCGGGLSISRSSLVKDLVGKLAFHAREAGAEAVVTACPLCQVNLEMRQDGSHKLPVFYFTELIGLALGLPESAKWWKKHLIDPRPLLSSLGLAA
jgi:heterodisulfide reductase subunit B2